LRAKNSSFFLWLGARAFAVLRGVTNNPADRAMPDVMKLKRLVSSRLLQIPGVSGVGLPGDRLTVYLDHDYDSDRLRSEVRAVVRSIAPSAEVAFLVRGPFRAQPA